LRGWLLTVCGCSQAPSPDVYRGQFTKDNYPGDDLGALYAEEVRALCKEAKKNGRTVAAFIAEGMQSCGGQVIPPANYFKNVYKYVKTKYINLITQFYIEII